MAINQRRQMCGNEFFLRQDQHVIWQSSDVRAGDCGRVRKRGPKKSNSERGKEYRAKCQKREEELVERVLSLREQIATLSSLQLVAQQKSLQRPHSETGSFGKVVREYCRLFQRGWEPPAACTRRCRQDSLRLQQEFVRRVMVDGVRFGQVYGADEVLEQWRLYTQTHADMLVTIGSITVIGPEESPVVEWVGCVHVRVTRETLARLFPHVLKDESLVQKLVGKRVTYKCVNQFHFASDGRIESYDVDIDFMDALGQAGATIEDCTVMLDKARIADQFYIVHDTDNDTDAMAFARPRGPVPSGAASTHVRGPSDRRLNIEYVLS